MLICSKWVFFEGICLPGILFAMKKGCCGPTTPVGSSGGGVFVSMGWVIGSMPSGKGRCGAHLGAWRFRALSLAPGGLSCLGWRWLWILDPQGVISPLSEAAEQEWEQKCPVLIFGNAHGAQGSEALGWSCHLLAFARLGGGTLKPKSLKSRRWAASNQIIAPKAGSLHQQRQTEGFNSSSFALIVEIEK